MFNDVSLLLQKIFSRSQHLSLPFLTDGAARIIFATIFPTTLCLGVLLVTHVRQ